MPQKVDALVRSVQAARAARVCQDEEVTRTICGAEGLRPEGQPPQALLLDDGRASGVGARKGDDQVGGG
eukprot:scaffold30557_cov133-Isochrysis_galbana.AAC.1